MLSVVLFWSCAGVMDKQSRQVFLNRGEPFSVTVYPVHVVVSETTTSDTSLQMEVVAHLNEKGYALAVASDEDVTIPFEWGMNQAKMFRRSAESFAQNQKGKELSTDYALLIEMLSIQVESNMGGVHYYIVDTKGNVVDGSLCNSHWEEFTSVTPTNRHEGLKVAFNLLKHLEVGG